MKYNTDEALKEISRRGRQIRKEHERRVTRLLSLATFITAFALIGVMGVLTDGGAYNTQSAYGSFLLSPEAGSYVLTAVVVFVLGVVVTLTIQHYKKSGRTQHEQE